METVPLEARVNWILQHLLLPALFLLNGSEERRGDSDQRTGKGKVRIMASL